MKGRKVNICIAVLLIIVFRNNAAYLMVLDCSHGIINHCW